MSTFIGTVFLIDLCIPVGDTEKETQFGPGTPRICAYCRTTTVQLAPGHSACVDKPDQSFAGLPNCAIKSEW